MKKIILITVLLTLFIIFGGYKIVEATSDYPFCGSCHSWDGAIAETNLSDEVHGKSNKKGIHVKCTDCHLPHDSMIGYLFTKAKNGIAEGFTTLTGDPSKKDWIANREYARKNYTFDSSCLKCHEDIARKGEGNATRAVSKMHEKYLELKNTKDALKCTDCHKHVGHKELGKMLIEQKHKTANSWEEWKETNGVK